MPIVQATGSAATSRNPYLAKRIEEAMAQAVKDALAEGIDINDSETIRARMMAAREAVKAESKG